MQMSLQIIDPVTARAVEADIARNHQPRYCYDGRHIHVKSVFESNMNLLASLHAASYKGRIQRQTQYAHPGVS
jgi:hypothetical protein